MSFDRDRHADHAYEFVHGTAQFPTHGLLQARGFGPGGRLSFGYARSDPHNQNAQEISYDGVRHVNLIAANRQHKTTTLIRQALLHTSSLVAVDIRGEIAAATYRYRTEVLGQTVILFDPANIIAKHLGVEPDCIDFMDLIDLESAIAFETAMAIGDGIVIPSKTSDGSFWDRTSIDFLSTGTMGAKDAFPNVSLPEALEIFNRGREAFNETIYGEFEDLEAAREGTNTKKLREGYIDSTNQLVADGAARMVDNEERTLQNTLATVRSNTWAFNTTLMRNALGRSGKSLKSLPDGNLTVYIVLPSFLLREYRNIVRLIVTMCMRVVSESQRFPDPPVLYLWDETAAVGRSEQLLDSYALQAGDGNQIISVWHDLKQMRRIYPEFETFINNAAMNIVFASNDLMTLDYFSRLSGTTDVRMMSGETAKKRISPFYSSDYQSLDDSILQRMLVTPDRLKNMPPYEAAFYPANLSPVFGFKGPYFLDRRFRNNGGRPVYEVPKRYRDAPAPPALNFTSNAERLERELVLRIPNP